MATERWYSERRTYRTTISVPTPSGPPDDGRPFGVVRLFRRDLEQLLTKGSVLIEGLVIAQRGKRLVFVFDVPIHDGWDHGRRPASGELAIRELSRIVRFEMRRLGSFMAEEDPPLDDLRASARLIAVRPAGRYPDPFYERNPDAA